MNELEGKVAIVSGGSRGLGRAISLELAKSGADLAINYRKSVAEAESLIEEIKSMGRRAIAYRADVSSFEDAQKMVEDVLKELGRIDILVNNAGINMDSVIWKMSEEQWDNVINVNLKGYFNYIRAVSPIFREQLSGKIINITSINGLRGKFGQSNYSAAKAGIIGLTKTLARELGKYNVNVNAIAPGMIETDMIKDLPQDIKDNAIRETVLGRLGKPEDVAYLVVFLCSDKARHVTGEIIKVDGGQYI
ncbi:MAG: beta-ketoacyl-ACP reductase [Acidobacteriota bacterium]